jgi:hypothetical protein
MISANGRRICLNGAHCLILHGRVAHGPDHLQGRSLDDLLTWPHAPQNQLTAHPYVQQDEEHILLNNPWEGQPDLHFQDQETAALTQAYLDHGGDQYHWHDLPPSSQHPQGLLLITARSDRESGSAPFSLEATVKARRQDGRDRGASTSRTHEVLASAPAHKKGRDVMESGWRAILKGELHHKILHVPYYLRYPFPMGFPPTPSTSTTTGQPGTTGVGPSPGAQQAAAGAGASSPVGGPS